MPVKNSPLLPLLPQKTLDAVSLPDATYLENMRRIAQGDLGSVLTGGDRLMALSGLLKSVARGSRTTPQEVMAQVQQTALGRASTQMQLAQLEAAAAQKARRDAALQAFAATLPKDKLEQFLTLSPEEQEKMRAEYVNPTPFQMTERNGEAYMVFRSGPPKKLDLPTNVKGAFREIDYNGDGVAESVFVNEYTGEPILNKEGKPLTYKLGMTPAQKDAASRGWANVGIAQARLAMDKADGGGGGGANLLPEPKEVVIDGKPTMMQWDKKSQRYVPFRQQNVSKPKAGFTPTVPVSIATGRPVIRQ